MTLILPANESLHQTRRGTPWSTHAVAPAGDGSPASPPTPQPATTSPPNHGDEIADQRGGQVGGQVRGQVTGADAGAWSSAAPAAEDAIAGRAITVGNGLGTLL